MFTSTFIERKSAISSFLWWLYVVFIIWEFQRTKFSVHYVDASTECTNINVWNKWLKSCQNMSGRIWLLLKIVQLDAPWFKLFALITSLFLKLLVKWHRVTPLLSCTEVFLWCLFTLPYRHYCMSWCGTIWKKSFKHVVKSYLFVYVAHSMEANRRASLFFHRLKYSSEWEIMKIVICIGICFPYSFNHSAIQSHVKEFFLSIFGMFFLHVKFFQTLNTTSYQEVEIQLTHKIYSIFKHYFFISTL